jgi:hypothetical protein
MKVKCIRDYPSEDQLRLLGGKFFRSQRFPVTVGQIYLVLGLSFLSKEGAWGSGLVFEIAADDGEPASVPECLFQIEDPRISHHWELNLGNQEAVRLWPPSFYRAFYHEDLAEGSREVREDYKRVLSLMLSEFIG